MNLEIIEVNLSSISTQWDRIVDTYQSIKDDPKPTVALKCTPLRLRH